MGTGVGRNLMEIAMMVAGIALISMFVRNADKTSQLITTGASAFGGLLNTATGGTNF